MIEIKHRHTGKVLLQVVTRTLEGADLSRRDLRGANFHGADLTGADLSRSRLDEADLEGANLRGVNMYHASLKGANLYEASLWGADLSGVRYDKHTRWPDRFQPEERGCVLDNTGWFKWRPASMTIQSQTTVKPAPKGKKGKNEPEPSTPKLIFGSPGAIASSRIAPGLQIRHRETGLVLHRVNSEVLEGAVLKGLELRCADFSRQRLHHVNFEGTDLTSADLRGADLRGAEMGGAELLGADLTGADLRDVNLRGANLGRAILRGASLTGAKLWGADLTGAVYDIQTRWPDGFDPPSRGAVLSPLKIS